MNLGDRRSRFERTKSREVGLHISLDVEPLGGKVDSNLSIIESTELPSTLKLLLISSGTEGENSAKRYSGPSFERITG